ncbi:predicted protein [Naegleria gruberi]|uniref:Predicted protein n=1 Tax=Naegleria gruberi TaxID=5762 RepID=D2UXG8_NAEGR|nr:uncharacterized protein NAEGRDRAFT_29269 [Naegleria gruberi]EFC50281.1 predicted protein [Naegleria gruberi]|eukprot:XP_002683025.1 predicted protein [Naegleria gruberi strain NEG-M]
MGLDKFIAQYVSNNTSLVHVAVIGFPFDEGVKRNGGRVGSKHAPTSFRKMIRRAGTVVNPENNINCSSLRIVDLGNVVIDDETNLEEAHQRLEEYVFKAFNILQAETVFVIGGGNDESFSNAKGLLRHVQQFDKVGVVNIDAHLDVRDLKNGLHHSGSPFRRLLETDGFVGKHFVEFGAQGTQCSQTHANFVYEKEAKIYWLSKDIKDEQSALPIFKKVIEEDFKNTEKIFVSFDLDCVSMSWASGVSCPSPLGLTAQNALDIAFYSGNNSKVKLFDLSEYNPIIEEYNTGKLVAAIFVQFVLGVASKTKIGSSTI